MGMRKYASDYTLENHVKPDGGVQTQRIYRGTWYTFQADSKTVRGLRRKLTAVTAAIIIFLLPMFLTATDLSRTAYVLLPLVAAFFPLYLLVATIRRLGMEERPFNREHRDKTDRRLRVAGVWLPVFLAIGLVGGIVYGVTHTCGTEELLCIASLVPALGLSVWLMSFRKAAATVEAEKES